MSTAPEILISSLDLQRLEALLASLPASSGADALRTELERADVLDPAEMPPTVVTMNSVVVFEIEETGERFEMALRYPRDAGGPGTLSVLAPMGSALLGLQIGQAIEWPTPGGKTRSVRVVDIAYQPEREGNYLQ